VAAARLDDYKRGLKTGVDTEGTIYKYLDDGEKQRIQEYQLISVVGMNNFIYHFSPSEDFVPCFFHNLSVKFLTSHSFMNLFSYLSFYHVFPKGYLIKKNIYTFLRHTF
jgi:hypothetical protein